MEGVLDVREGSLFGIETEYACRIGRVDRGVQTLIFKAILDHVARRVPALRGPQQDDLFLANGGRLYVDATQHLEFATAECATPREAVAQMCAGDRLVEEAAAAAARDFGGMEICITKGNVDYAGPGATWGSHENYLLNRSGVGDIVPYLVSFLATRIVYSGSGGFRNDPVATEFTLSPRSWHMTCDSSDGTESRRGLVNTRDESHAKGYRRLHLICGDSLCGRLSSYLRVGVTALVVRFLDLGFRPDRRVLLERPVEAMRAFAADPGLTARAMTRSGTELTATQIQRGYLSFVERCLDTVGIPLWAPEVVIQWRRILDRLETGGAAAVATELDWAIKYAAYEGWLKNRGWRWESLRQWAETLAGPLKEWCAKGEHFLELLDLSGERLRSFAESVEARHGVPSQDVLKYFVTRQQLFEADTRFSQLGKGTFAEIDRRRLLEDRPPGWAEADVDAAMSRAPKTTRARARGEAVRKYSGKWRVARYSCDWSAIRNCDDGLFLDLSDPWCQTARRTRPSVNGGVARHEYPSCDDELARQWSVTARAMWENYRSGRHEEAHHQMSLMGALFRAHHIPGSVEQDFYRATAWVAARRGELRKSVDALERLDACSQPGLGRTVDHLHAYRFLGLGPHHATGEILAERSSQLFAEGAAGAERKASFLGHMAHHLLSVGQPDRARVVLEGVAHDHARRDTMWAELGAAQADLGEAYRMLGCVDAAWACLSRAGEFFTENKMHGDLACGYYAGLAKLQPEAGVALDLLCRALDIQVGNRDGMGEARTRLLMARVGRDEQAALRHLARVVCLGADRDGLANCPLLAKIIQNWQAWVAGEPDPEPMGIADAFWHL